MPRAFTRGTKAETSILADSLNGVPNGSALVRSQISVLLSLLELVAGSPESFLSRVSKAARWLEAESVFC